MPTSYSGVATATQAPSPPPGPGVIPIVQLPADGDNENGATFAQEGKVLADFAAWSNDPLATSGSWAQRTWGVRNARAQRRWFLDHMGHPAGRVIKWTEYWPVPSGGTADGQVNAGTAEFVKSCQVGWSAVVVKGGSGNARALVRSPGDPISPPPSKLHNLLDVAVGTTIGDISRVGKNATCIFSADGCIAMDWEIWPGTVAVADSQIFGGFGARPVSGLIGGLLYTDGSANWKAVVGDGSTLSSVVNTGVAVAGAAWQSMRVEWWGANVSDDSANAMRFYIAGALVATITTALPTGGFCALSLGAEKLATPASQLQCFFGPVQYAQSY